ncbi:MAG TPA: hypothetical protein VKR58_13325 [Aquella sp.]|nr:hypothetical protein [Aquella sp.]
MKIVLEVCEICGISREYTYHPDGSIKSISFNVKGKLEEYFEYNSDGTILSHIVCNPGTPTSKL